MFVPAPRPSEVIIPKESSSAFHGTPLLQYLIGHGVDTVLVTGCQTSACSRATGTVTDTTSPSHR